ncbi:MAG: MATE family efflux transporter [Oscillospiraceae bacterium]|nr:MATE family efflux transporter [Oscillospiraceae bacterium]MBR6207487.1 MATE family efflux transporter [Oscillospiraceae bacterium]
MAAKQNNFTEGPVSGVILRMGLPMVAAQLVNVLYNIVDRIYIGHIPQIGAAALTGVGVAMPLITILSAFAGLFGSGGTPLFSIALGRGDREEAGSIMGNAAAMLLIASIGLTALFYAISPAALPALGATENTIPHALRYLRVYLTGTPLVFATLGLNSYINAQGFARRGMMTVMLGAAANIVLDPIFIFGFGMGVAGAALATVLSQALSAYWCLSFLLSRRVPLPLHRSQMGLRWSVIKRIWSLGIVDFVMAGTNSVVQGLANRQLGLYGGDLYVGSMTIISSLRTVYIEIVHGIGAGTKPVIGFCYGAGLKRRVRDGIRFNTLLLTGMAIFFWVSFTAFARPIIHIFTNDEDLIAVAVPAVRIFFIGNCFMALQSSAQSVFQGLGMARQALTFSLLRKVFIVVPLMLIFPRFLGAYGVFWSEPVSDLLGGGAAFLTMMLTLYRRLNREIKEEETCRN